MLNFAGCAHILPYCQHLGRSDYDKLSSTIGFESAPFYGSPTIGRRVSVFRGTAMLLEWGYEVTPRIARLLPVRKWPPTKSH